MDVKSLTDIEIDSKIQDISKKIYLVSNSEVLNQLYNFLDLLYQEQDERSFMESSSMEDGISYDSDKNFSVKETDTKEKKKQNKNFMDKMPKIEQKWNKNNPRNNQQNESD